MRGRGFFVLLLGLTLVVPGCREYGLEEGIVPVSWVRVAGDVEFSRIAMDPDGAIYGAVPGGDGQLLRSDDRGQTWRTVLAVRPAWDAVTRIAFGPDGTGYATVVRPVTNPTLREFGLYRSHDGETWQPLDQTWTARLADALAVTPNGTVLLGTEGPGVQGLFLSTDEGETWNPTFLQSRPTGGGIAGRTLTTGAGGVVLLRLYGAGQDEDGLYRSENGGISWFALPRVNFSVESLTIADESIVFATGDFLPPRRVVAFFRSGDLGSSWRQDPIILPFSRIRDMAPDPRQYLYLAAGHDGVRRSEDGFEWEEINAGLPVNGTGRLIFEVIQVLLASDGYLYANTEGGLYRSTGRAE